MKDNVHRTHHHSPAPPNQKTIFILSSVPSHLQNAGNRTRLFQMAEDLKELGYLVHLIWFGDLETSDLSLTQMQEYWGSRLHIVETKGLPSLGQLRGNSPLPPSDFFGWCTKEVKTELKALVELLSPQIAIAEYAFMANLFDGLPKDIIRIIDTHDVFTNRTKKFADHGILLSPSCFTLTEQEERELLNKADSILAIQETEAMTFRNMTQKPVFTVGCRVPCHLASQGSSPPALVFIGSRSARNATSIGRFIEEEFPHLSNRFPKLELKVFGGVADLLTSTPGVQKLGYVADLASHVSASDIAINPEIFATGLSIKNLTALGLGLPLVTTPEAARGIEMFSNSAFWIAKKGNDFVDRIASLLSATEERARVAKAGRETIFKLNEVCLSQLAKALDG